MKFTSLHLFLALTIGSLVSAEKAEEKKTPIKATALDHPLFDIEPSILTLAKGKGTFKLKLKKSPSARAPGTVSFLLPEGLISDKCALTFNSDNFNVTQDVTIDTHPTLGNGKPEVVAIGLEACLPDTNITSPAETKGEYHVKPDLVIGGTCTSQGDPHIKTLDGKTFTNRVNGAHYLFYSDSLEIQALVIRGTAAWNGKMAVRYLSTAYVVSVEAGKLSAKLLSDRNTKEILIVTTGTIGKTIELLTGDGTKIIVTAQTAFAISINVTPGASSYSNTTGHCFNEKDSPVPATHNMFDGKLVLPAYVMDAPAQAYTCNAKPRECLPYVEYIPFVPTVAVTPNIAIPAGCTPVIVTEKYDPSAVQAPVEIPDYKPVEIEVARNRCEAVIPDRKDPSVNRQFYVDSCTTDYSLAGILSIADDARKLYESECRQSRQTKASSVDPVARQEAKMVEENLETCPANCGGPERGECATGTKTCECKAGYLGDACQFDENVPAAIKLQSGSSRLVMGVAAVLPLIFLF